MLSDIRDRFLRLRLQRDEKEIKIGFTVSALIIIALLANVIYLNLYVIKLSAQKPSEAISVIASPTPNPTIVPSPTPTPGSPETSEKATTANKVKDYYLNLGSGSSQSSDWADVSGTLSTIDLGQYQNIKEVHLETNTNVPTANGTVSVRLFNKTDGVAVWNSERTVQAEANGALLISQSLIYDVGAKFYQVQMKTQLNVPATLVQSRLHITAQ